MLGQCILHSTGIFRQSSGAVVYFLHPILQLDFLFKNIIIIAKLGQGTGVWEILLVLVSRDGMNVVLHIHILKLIVGMSLFYYLTEVMFQHTV